MHIPNKVIGQTVYFGLGSNDSLGNGDDGASAVYDVVLAGAAPGAAPVHSGAAVLKSHVDMPSGAWEIAIPATVGNGFAAGNTYLVWVTITVDGKTPTGFQGSFDLVSDNGRGSDDRILVSADEHESGLVVAGVKNLTSGSAAISTPAESVVITTGNVVSGSYTDTRELDNVYHQIEDVAGVIDLYYQFDVGGNGVPVQVIVNGRLNSANDDLDVFAWNWTSSAWEQIGNLPGKGSSIDDELIYNLFSTHVGSGVNIGKVRVRFQGTGLTSADLFVDQVFVSYAVVSQSVGYADGAIWIDTNNGQPGTTPFVNGVADNPVDSLADALTLANDPQLNLRIFKIAPSSSITFEANMDGFVLDGTSWDLALNGQSCSATHVTGANVSGVCTGAIDPHFIDCRIGNITIPPSDITRCSLEGKITLGSVGELHIHDCHSHGNPVIDLGVAIGDSIVHLAEFWGVIEFENIGQAGTDAVMLEGFGEYILNANCVGGSLGVGGHFNPVDNAGGAVVVTNKPPELDSNLVKMNAAAQPVLDLEASTEGMRQGTVVGDPANSQTFFKSDIVETNPNQFINGVLYFRSGLLKGQRLLVEGYVFDTVNGNFTVSQTANLIPQDGDEFVVL